MENILDLAGFHAGTSGTSLFKFSQDDMAKLQSKQATLFITMENGPQFEAKISNS